MTIEEIDKQIQALQQERYKLASAEAARKSRAIIDALSITKKDVTLSDEPGMPFHGDAYEFGKFLEKNRAETRFCEWNGLLYHTAALRKGLMIGVGCGYGDIPK